MNNNLVNIVEDYIAEKRNGSHVDEKKYARRIGKLKKNEDQIHEIMIEMDDDCDKELLAGAGVKSAKKGIVISVIIFVALASTSILSALGLIFQGKLFVLFYGGIAAAFLYGMKCYSEIVAVKQRKARRELKWKNWN